MDLLVPDEHVGDSLVLAEQGDAEEDFHVGSLPQLLVVGGLLNQVKDLGGEGLLSQGVDLGVNLIKLCNSNLFFMSSQQ